MVQKTPAGDAGEQLDSRCRGCRVALVGEARYSGVEDATAGLTRAFLHRQCGARRLGHLLRVTPAVGGLEADNYWSDLTNYGGMVTLGLFRPPPSGGHVLTKASFTSGPLTLEGPPRPHDRGRSAMTVDAAPRPVSRLRGRATVVRALPLTALAGLGAALAWLNDTPWIGWAAVALVLALGAAAAMLLRGRGWVLRFTTWH